MQWGQRRYNHDPTQWLGHADAPQVSDLPKRGSILDWRSLTADGMAVATAVEADGSKRSETAALKETRGRQVGDLPRIGVAEPLGPVVVAALRSDLGFPHDLRS